MKPSADDVGLPKHLPRITALESDNVRRMRLNIYKKPELVMRDSGGFKPAQYARSVKDVATAASDEIELVKADISTLVDFANAQTEMTKNESSSLETTGSRVAALREEIQKAKSTQQKLCQTQADLDRTLALQHATVVDLENQIRNSKYRSAKARTLCMDTKKSLPRDLEYRSAKLRGIEGDITRMNDAIKADGSFMNQKLAILSSDLESILADVSLYERVVEELSFQYSEAKDSKSKRVNPMSLIGLKSMSSSSLGLPMSNPNNKREHIPIPRKHANVYDQAVIDCLNI